MKIVRNKTTFQVFYIFENKEKIRLDKNGMHGRIRALDMKDSTHEIVEDVSRPELWFGGGVLTYEDDWGIYNQDLYNNAYDELVQVKIEEKCDDVTRIRLQKTYSDTFVLFSDGTSGTIQLRNDFDRQNLSDVALGALAISVLQNPNKYMQYRDAENITHTIRAGDMVEIALNILGIKQEVVNKSWQHKDTLRSFTTLEQVKNYNINDDWPV